MEFHEFQITLYKITLKYNRKNFKYNKINLFKKTTILLTIYSEPLRHLDLNETDLTFILITHYTSIKYNCNTIL